MTQEPPPSAPAGSDWRNSAEWLRSIANAVPQLVWSATAEGVVDFYNYRYTEYAGLTRKPDGTWEWAPVVHPDDAAATLEAWTRATATGEVYDVEHRVERADGTFRWHVSRGVPVRDAQGRVVRWYGSATDIHDLKTAERALHENEARLRATFEGVADGIISLDAEGQALDLNPAFVRMHGFASVDDARLSFDRFVDDFETRDANGADIPPDALPFSRAVRGEAISDMEIEARRRTTGDLLFIGSYNAVPVRDARGAISQVVVTIRDITDRRRAEERQRLLVREVDHRARNALAVVQAVLTLTRADTAEDFAEAVRGRVQTIARCHTRLTENRWLTVGLRNLLDDELQAYEAPDAARIALDGPAVAIVGSAVQPVSMILHELVTNAVKHGALSGPEGHLTVEWTLRPDGGLRLRWREAGGPPVRPPARRGVGSTVMTGSARQVAGTLDMQWEAAGLTCTLTLPPAAIGAVAPAAASGDAGAHASGPAPTPQVRRRILVVEDEALLATETAALLGSLGYEPVGPAATLDEALALAATERDLAAAILDLNLGGRSSLVVADVLEARGVAVIFATGYADAPDPVPQERRRPVVQKPVTPGRLADALREVL